MSPPWTVACQVPRSMEFSRQEYWSELPFPSPGDHPKPGIKPRTPGLQADSLPSEPPGKPKVNQREAKTTSLKPVRSLHCSGSRGTNQRQTLVDVKVVANRNNTASTHVFFSFSGRQSQVNDPFSLLTLCVRITHYLAKERKALKKLLCDELIRNKQPIYMNE